MPFGPSGNLPSHVDPKLAWAQMNLLDLPVELNHASRNELLRIPGIGPHGANAILNARREQRINNISDLRRIGLQTQRALPFILIDGRRPNYQPSLFSF
jgi:predicted DNA-binding helix-hairpin-helix protein